MAFLYLVYVKQLQSRHDHILEFAYINMYMLIAQDMN